MGAEAGSALCGGSEVSKRVKNRRGRRRIRRPDDYVSKVGPASRALLQFWKRMDRIAAEVNDSVGKRADERSRRRAG